jgi:RimJ/RimL family protein N-acetyltransferase
MIELRVLSAQDAAEFQRLRLEALRDSPTAFSSSYEDERDRDLAKIAERISPERLGLIFGAFDGGRLVGTAGFRREGGRKLEHKSFIWGMYVTPTHRRRGIGRQLIESVLSHAASLSGLRRINIGANAANSPAIALYEATGFKSYGMERAFLIVDGVEQDEILLSYVIERA